MIAELMVGLGTTVSDILQTATLAGTVLASQDRS